MHAYINIYVYVSVSQYLYTGLYIIIVNPSVNYTTDLHIEARVIKLVILTNHSYCWFAPAEGF